MPSIKREYSEFQYLSSPLSRNQKLALILLILMFHGSSIFMLFNMRTDNAQFQRLFPILTEQETDKQTHTTQTHTSASVPNSIQKLEHPVIAEQEEWGAMKARASRFGAPVIFQEEPEFMVQEPPSTETSADTEKDPAQTTPDAQPAATQHAMNTTQSQDSKHILAQEQAAAPTSRDASTDSNTAATDTPLETILQETPALTSSDATHTDLVTLQEQQTDTVSSPNTAQDTAAKTDNNALAEQLKTTAGRNSSLQPGAHTHTSNTTNPDNYFPGWGKKDAAPITKKMVSMAQLARGFLDNVRNEGTHAITMIGGKEGGRITADQLKMERYVQRLNWYLQNSFHMHRERYRRQHPATTAEVRLVLERTGRIQDVHIIRSSGDPLLDDHTLFVFQDAGASFPPVPHYLPQDPFVITYIVEYNTFESPPQRAGFKIFS